MSQEYKYNNKQKLCIMHNKGPALVNAGAGTGKTRVIVGRFQELLKFVRPYEILCVTFSNKAANELIERISHINNDSKIDEQIKKNELIEQNDLENKINISNLWVGTFHSLCIKLLRIYGLLPKAVSIIDEDDQKKILDKLFLTKYFKHIKNFREYEDLTKLPAEIQDAIEKYDTYLKENDLIDFSGIISTTIDHLQTNELVRLNVQNRFKYIMIDEYQDTNKSQSKLIELLLNEEKNLMCVGDHNQSIYGWRGASDNMLKFKDIFSSYANYTINHNYRSTIPILKAANCLISYNKNQSNELVFSEHDGPPVVICYSKEEFNFIAESIQKIQTENKLQKMPTIGILVRSSRIIKNIEESLINYNVSYSLLSGLNFFDRLEIKTALAYIKILYTKDPISLERVLTTPSKKMGEKTIEKIEQQMKLGISLEDALDSLKKQEAKNFAAKIRSWKAFVGKPRDLMHMILEESGLYDFFSDRMDNLKILLNKLDKFTNMIDFLENFFTLEFESSSNVLIMTVHGSKGLEFDYVFIPSMIEGFFPNFLAIQEGNLEEERRLAYVAFTRAKKQLIITYSLEQGYGQNFGASRFISCLSKNNTKLEYKVFNK